MKPAALFVVFVLVTLCGCAESPPAAAPPAPSATSPAAGKIPDSDDRASLGNKGGARVDDGAPTNGSSPMIGEGAPAASAPQSASAPSPAPPPSDEGDSRSTLGKKGGAREDQK